jgi:lipoprotein NlpI
MVAERAMLRLAVSAVLLIALAAPAAAGGREDFAAAVAAAHRQDYAEAIRLYTRGLAAPDVSPADQSIAHANRAVALVRLHRYDEALADYDAAVALAPGNGQNFYQRGIIRFYQRRYAEAAADLAHGLAIRPREPYAVLWLHLARGEAQQDDASEFRANAARLAPDMWPAPVIAFYRDEITLTLLRRVAKTGTPDAREAQTCESDFYLGALRHLQGDRREAQRALKAALAASHPDWAEYGGAESELAWLADEGAKGRR